jgi:hypothetical protein
MASDAVKRNGVGGTADADRYLADLRRIAKALIGNEKSALESVRKHLQDCIAFAA